MRNKKLLPALTVGVTAMLLIAGCSSQASEEAEAPAGEPIELTYAMWDASQEPVFKKILAAFTAENPNITVKTQVIAFKNYWTKRQTEASNGTLPDVFWMNPQNFPMYASEGILAPIEDGNGATSADIPETMRDLYTYNDKLYTFPNNRDAIAVWYNKALFDAAGVEYPSDTWTTDDFADTAAALTKDGVWGATVTTDSRATYGSTIRNEGGNILNDDRTASAIDSDAGIKGVQFWADLVASGSSPTLTQIAEDDPFSLFLSGKVAMIPTGSWMALSFADSPLATDGSLGVAPYPYGSAGSNVTSTSSLGNMMPATAKHPEASLALIQFLGSKKAAEIYASNGIGMTAYPEFDQQYIDHFEASFDLSPYSKAVEIADPIPRTTVTSGWAGDVNTVIGKAINGDISVEEAVKSSATIIDEAIAAAGGK